MDKTLTVAEEIRVGGKRADGVLEEVGQVRRVNDSQKSSSDSSRLVWQRRSLESMKGASKDEKSTLKVQ